MFLLKLCGMTHPLEIILEQSFHRATDTSQSIAMAKGLQGWILSLLLSLGNLIARRFFFLYLQLLCLELLPLWRWLPPEGVHTPYRSPSSHPGLQRSDVTSVPGLSSFWNTTAQIPLHCIHCHVCAWCLRHIPRLIPLFSSTVEQNWLPVVTQFRPSWFPRITLRWGLTWAMRWKPRGKSPFKRTFSKCSQWWVRLVCGCN